MPRLLQQQDEILDTSARLNSLTEVRAWLASSAARPHCLPPSLLQRNHHMPPLTHACHAALACHATPCHAVPLQRVGEDFQQAQDKLAEVMEGVFASAELPDEEQNPYVRTTSPFNTAEALRRTLPTNMPIAAPEDLPQELAAIAADIQSTNQALRRLEGNFKDVSFSLGVLQEGAEARDAQTEAYREALLQLADDMEAQEAEQRALEEMLAVRAAEKRAQEEARRCGHCMVVSCTVVTCARNGSSLRPLHLTGRPSFVPLLPHTPPLHTALVAPSGCFTHSEEAMRRELDELVAAASAAQAAQASAAVAETIEATVAQAAAELPPVKVCTLPCPALPLV